ncbi:hypothetical protein Avbf_15192 [Armadillidium vulgare]|nr:hypothetical protein Avbf_15192 [Armadillidium vulgare]
MLEVKKKNMVYQNLDYVKFIQCTWAGVEILTQRIKKEVASLRLAIAPDHFFNLSIMKEKPKIIK